MDSASVTSSGSIASLAGSQAETTVGIAVLKKVLDIQTRNAMVLIQSLPQPTPSSNPPNLGAGVDTFA